MESKKVGFMGKVLIIIVLLGTSISANNMKAMEVEGNEIRVVDTIQTIVLPRKMMKDGLFLFQFGICPLIYMPCKKDSDCLQHCACNDNGICGPIEWSQSYHILYICLSDIYMGFSSLCKIKYFISGLPYVCDGFIWPTLHFFMYKY